MAGMAWTLHPALFYDKYGPVLIQLWESGALSSLFRPVRRMSKTIGNVIASGFTSTAPPGPVAQPAEEASVLHITDESVATDDEAWTRVNRDPGDTSPEPSTSQQNELAFQGDLYTQMRRNRRQQERIKEIRESRRKFVEGGSGSHSEPKRRGLPGRGNSILAPKKEKGFGKKVRSAGTPLADMECAPPVRAVVIDVADFSDSAENSKAEDVGSDPAAGSAHMLCAEELLPDNDSLKAFRAISGHRKRGTASPPPDIHSRSDPQSETSSLTAVQAAEAHVDIARSGESVMASTPDEAKLSFIEKECKTPKKGQKLSPPEQDKSLQYSPAENKTQGVVLPKKSILCSSPVKKTESLVSRKAYKKRQGQAATPSSVTASESCATTGIVSLSGIDALETTMPFKGKSLAGDDSAVPNVATKTAAKKDKTKRRKHKKSHRKRSKDKLIEESAGALQGSSRKGTEKERRADSETELRRKLETWDPSQDKDYHLASSVQLSSASKDSPDATVATSAEIQAAKVTDIAASQTTFPRRAAFSPTGAIADQEFYMDIKWLQEGPVKIPSLPAHATPMVHTKIGVGQRHAGRMEDKVAEVSHLPGAEAPTMPVKSSAFVDVDYASESNLPTVERLSSGQGSSRTKEAEHRAVIKPSAAVASAETFTAGWSAPSSHHASERHRKHRKKRRSKPPAVAEDVPPPLAASVSKDVVPRISNCDVPLSLTAEGAEKTMDEAVASSRHRPRRSRSKKHGGKSKKARRKAAHAADLVSTVNGGEVASATQIDDSTATGVPQGAGKPDVSTTQPAPAQAIVAETLITTVASVAPTTTGLVLPFSTDFTMSAISSGPSTSEQRPTNVTVVQGDEVKIHLDLTAHSRGSAFWPFGRKGHKKKK